MAATIAAVYPHMNHIGGDGFWLVREPSGRIRALMAAGAAGSAARPELYREAGHEAIPPRGPLAALTVPGAIAGWMLALEGRQGAGRPAAARRCCSRAAIRHAREGYAVTRSQARLTAEKLAELKDVPGFAQTFLVDGKPPPPARRSSSRRSRRRSISSPMPGSTISIAAMSGARSPPISNASAAR